MAETKKTAKTTGRTLRQTAEANAQPKKRRLKAPVGKLASPLRKAKQGKPGKVGRILVPKYLRNSWAELKEVTWPDRRQTAKLTFAVIAFATVFGFVIAVVDFGLDKLFRQLLLK